MQGRYSFSNANALANEVEAHNPNILEYIDTDLEYVRECIAANFDTLFN